MPDAAEFTVKQQRVQTMLTELGYDSLIMTRRSNIAWYTCGGEAVASRVSRTSPVYLVLTPDKLYAVGYTMDLPNTVDRSLVGLDVEPVLLPTFGKTMEEAVLGLVVGKAAADDPYLGLDDVQAELVKRYEPYTPQEMARYRQLGQIASRIHKEVAEWVQPGMTERDVLARMWYLALEQGAEGHYMFVGSDENIKKYRHPVPTDKAIDKVVLIAPGIAKWGLLCASTRMVYFETPPEDIRRRYQAAATMQAALMMKTQTGVHLKELFDFIWEQFAEQGYPDERYNHFHGGPIGYWDSFAGRMQDPAETVQPNMAFTYYITITGVKSEELLLFDQKGVELVTADPDWPMLTIDMDDDETVEIPDMLVRD